MRNLGTDTTPSLFSSEPIPPLTTAVDEPAREEPTPNKVARDFVRWCCSFGRDFHNSPDVTNLRYWLHQTKVKTADLDEDELLLEARRLYVKRIEQSLAT